MSVEMGPKSSSYLPPAYPPVNFVALTPTMIKLLDREERLRRYTGIFDRQDLVNGNHATSLFTGYQSLAGGSASTPVVSEGSGGSLHGQVLIDAVRADDIDGLLAEISKCSDWIEGSARSDALLDLWGNDEIRAG